ncbi:hypothetical protein MLD38_015091 [Melastoma candidum]|uniref:Uncharacterized protein n=1 Tax=Melastoma candidum TaxID=119954 RepID=A0ACB9REU1_9MYRT|nr:hypothetical protein MLD38_015091 [Melastoma candidum]
MAEDTGSPGWSASFFMQTTEDIARAVAVAAAAATATATHSPRPSVVFTDRDASGSPLQKLRRHVSSVLKGFSTPPEVKYSVYNPEILTSQKRQWTSCQLQYLDHRSIKEPSRLFESMHQSLVEPNLEPQVLFVYPPEKPLPLKYKDILSFCFPGGVEVYAVERTPSMSDLNEILVGQHLLPRKVREVDQGCCRPESGILRKPQ